MKQTRKLLAALLAALTFCAILAIPTPGVPLNAGRDALNGQFTDGKHGAYDYVAFTPDLSKGGKRPLMVWLHGSGSGSSPRAQLRWYCFSNWASDEYQSRFGEGGCFLLAPRASASIANAYDATMCGGLKSVIDAFIAENRDYIDTNRIYLAGYSTGGSMVWYMLDAYPTFFAAALPLASLIQPTLSGVEKLRDVSIWTFTSDRDPYVGATTTAALPSFRHLCSVSNRPEDVRMTRFSECFLADGSKKQEDGHLASDAEHYVWECVTFDMFMADGQTPYACASTKNGAGTQLTFTPGDALITWLAQQKRPEQPVKHRTWLDKALDALRALLRAILALFQF